MDGVINILKPAGVTSHDVVAKLRRIYKTKKVGHTGTLDPDAVEVLPICIGQGTRLVEYLMEKEKTYRTILKFGSETNTQDSSGEVTHNRGFLKGPASYMQGATNLFRDNGLIVRRILVTENIQPGKDYYLRFRQVLDNPTSELSFDYIELCPKDIYGSPEGEDIY